jgi:peroxiredoxin
VLCINDAAVMTAWAKDQKVEKNSIIKFVADPRGEATKGLGLAISEPPEKFGYYPRTKRFALILANGVVKKLHVCETPTDATGDSVPEASFAEQMLEDLKKLS